MFKIILSFGPSEESRIFVTNTEDLYVILSIFEARGCMEYKVINDRVLSPSDFSWDEPKFKHWVTKFYYEK